ncbi:MAG: leucine-rich repeat protein [Clostridia bacterium]|nr:leucine-rich repeat protein [Clostridia bacterium]
MKARVFLILAFVTVLLASAWIKISDELGLGTSVKASIDALEDKIGIVASKQNENNAEYKAEIEKLKLEINALKEEKESQKSEETKGEVNDEGFLYEIVDDGAVITGFSGKDTYIVIPSHIDGYEVVKIGESAFANSKVTTVIISEGIKELDWFAFYACPSLTSITLPKSISSIGYGAFDGVSSKFTVYCYSGTYAHSFAKSYGISHIAA